MTDFSRCVLGETGGDTPVDSRNQVQEAALSLVRQARLSLNIYTPDLEAMVYGTAPFVEAVTRLAVRHPRSMVRILIQQSRTAAANGHRLIEISYRFTSSVQIRKPASQFQDYNEAFLTVDERGLIHRNLADRFEGIVNFNNALQARALNRYFNQVWEMSEPDPQLRRLY